MNNEGISVVIACHNSSKRLPQTLEHVKQQNVPEHVQWEVIIVDNASTDNTAQIAQSIWGCLQGVSFRIVMPVLPEPNQLCMNLSVISMMTTGWQMIGYKLSMKK